MQYQISKDMKNSCLITNIAKNIFWIIFLICTYLLCLWLCIIIISPILDNIENIPTYGKYISIILCYTSIVIGGIYASSLNKKFNK